MKDSERLPKNMLEVLLQYSNDLVIYITKNFNIILANQAAIKFYNVDDPEKIHNQNFLEFCKTLNSICPISADYFAAPAHIDITLDSTTATSRIGTINWIITPIFLDKQIHGAVIIGKPLEFKKNNISHYLATILDCIPGCLYWKDRKGIYLGCNETTAKLAGLSSIYDIIGKNDWELWGEQAPSLIENDQRVIEGGEIVLVEEKLQVAGGNWIYFTGIKMPLRDERGNIIGLIGNSLDITELKNTQAELKKSKERAEQLSKAKSAFIANMSHDVKTPLSGIVGISEILADKSTGEEYDLLQSMLLSGQQLMRFIDNCIDLFRLEETDITLAQEHFSLELLLEQIVTLFQPAAQNKGLAFYYYYDHRIPADLYSSRIIIYRILINLISNAIKFTPKGSVTVKLELSEDSTEDEAIVHFWVEDTGRGIPQEQQEFIFERFFRGTPSYKGTFEGAGIGLFLVDKFVRVMHGNIQVISELEKGSSFVVTLPIPKMPATKKQNAIEVMSELPVYHTITKLSKILLVEDNFLAQKIANLILAPLCDHLDAVDTGEEALKKFEPGKYDLIFLDIGLPDISGYDISKIIRQKEQDTNYHVLIVALTAHDNNVIQKECLDIGIDKVISKPLTQKIANQIIREYLQHKA